MSVGALLRNVTMVVQKMNMCLIIVHGGVGSFAFASKVFLYTPILGSFCVLEQYVLQLVFDGRRKGGW